MVEAEEGERQKRLEEYNNAIKGTIAEQINNIDIPSYFDENELHQLQDGEIVVRGEKSDNFPNGEFQWGAYLAKNVNSFIIDDFNNDGLDDVAQIIAYTGGGSGYFYYFTIFINNEGNLKYLTQGMLGDRIFIKDIKYNSGVFTVDMITQGKGDDFMGFCCANVPKSIRFKLEGNNFVEADE